MAVEMGLIGIWGLMKRVDELKELEKFSFLGNVRVHCVAKIEPCEIKRVNGSFVLPGVRIRTQKGHVFHCPKDELVNEIE